MKILLLEVVKDMVVVVGGNEDDVTTLRAIYFVDEFFVEPEEEAPRFETPDTIGEEIDDDEDLALTPLLDEVVDGLGSTEEMGCSVLDESNAGIEVIIGV